MNKRISAILFFFFFFIALGLCIILNNNPLDNLFVTLIFIVTCICVFIVFLKVYLLLGNRKSKIEEHEFREKNIHDYYCYQKFLEPPRTNT